MWSCSRDDSMIFLFTDPFLKFEFYYSRALKKWGYTGFTLSVILSLSLSFRHNSFFVQYLENEWTE